jgi:hypothetical protein
MTASMSLKNVLPPHSSLSELLGEIRGFIEQARARAAQAVNATLVLLCWGIGHRIRRDLLRNKRAGYGEKIVQTLSAQLTLDYGRGYSRRNLFNMIRFAEMFPDRNVVQALSGQLGWSHFLAIIALDDPLKRDFYAEMCRLERWSVRTLQKKIGGLLFERTGLARKPVELALKLDKFKPEHKGQMELYLRWLDKHERQSNESPPLGIILCATKSDEQVELLELGKSGIHVAQYLTELPSRKVLEKKLHQAIHLTRQRLSPFENESLGRSHDGSRSRV